jgi:hypothetical protein
MTTSTAPEQAEVRAKRSRWLALLVLLVGIGVTAAVTRVVVTRDDDSASESSASPVSQVQASCRDWMVSSQGGVADQQWCADMFTWMNDQSDGSMTGSMMWQGPEQMGTACRKWVNDDRSPETGSSGKQRCADMVEWMSGHMSSSGGSWMMQNR